MNTTSRGPARLVAGSVAAAGIIASILGFASIANASTTPTSTHDTPVTVQPHNPHDPSATDTLRAYRDKASDVQKQLQTPKSASDAGGLMQASDAGGLMQASNAGGLMQATTPKA